MPTISRRTVLKAIGAALVAPCVKLRAEVDREKLLAAFCDDDDWSGRRWNLAAPFTKGSLTYASDYRHIIRAELPGCVEDGERRIPDVDELWRHSWHPNEFTPFQLPPINSGLLRCPPPRGFAYGTCPLCDDRRISFGEVHPTDQEFLDLKMKDWDVDTNTYRDPSCPLCRGETYEGPSQLCVHGIWMTYSRLKPIAALPSVRVTASKVKHYGLLFVADGFEGVAMGLQEL